MGEVVSDQRDLAILAATKQRDELRAELERVRGELLRCVETLRWYAAHSTYGFTETPDATRSNRTIDIECAHIAEDCGERARKALL